MVHVLGQYHRGGLVALSRVVSTLAPREATGDMERSDRVYAAAIMALNRANRF